MVSAGATPTTSPTPTPTSAPSVSQSPVSASPTDAPTTQAPTTTSPTKGPTSCDLLSQFGVPRAEPFSTVPELRYLTVHVSEGGPSLSVDHHRTKVQTTQNYNGVDEFSIQTANGVGGWYVNLKQCMTSHTMHNANPGFTLSGCTIPGIDGDYWINKVGDDEVWVMKDGSYAIYFSTVE
eukprot:CAMPEP_0197436066 /NCGR_PEP_ID=MMETSP1175-20131217/3535_1 /TAXON_ID=1003142 /ORGANISM="Triceratium dubium, Strain CCMP147" /LENGTH=178 /DNA_ID=CAMNT_0042965249 /DNA_START=315 /DNA_END=848 /DNA_ORIENTATION=+